MASAAGLMGFIQTPCGMKSNQSGGLQCGAHFVLAVGCEGDDGQADVFGADAQLRGCPFGCGGAGFAEHDVVNGDELFVQAACFCDVAGEGGAAHVGEEFGGDVGGDGDDAVAAAEQEGQGSGVVAGVDGEAFGGAVDEVDFAGKGAAGFFDAGDVGDLCQAQDGVVVHVDDGAAGYVVDDHGDVYGFGDGFEVAVDAFLRGFVVVGDDGECGVGACFFGGLGEFDGFDGVVGACAGDDGDAFGGVFDGCFDDEGLFGDG